VDVAELRGARDGMVGGLGVDEMALGGGRARVEGTESWVGCGIWVPHGGDIFVSD
jgi:hypothetical protein